ncbi:MAG: hypothetical protein ACUVWJ_09745 [Spirochaetota bacterium]
MEEKIQDMKILLKKGKTITRTELFKEKERFHKEQAKLPFEEKIRILVRLQEIAGSIKKDPEKKLVWKI